MTRVAAGSTEKVISGVHPTAIVHPRAQLGGGVSVGPYSIIHEHVSLGDGTQVGSHCELGIPSHDPTQGGMLRIGANSVIRSHSVFYEGSTIGDHLVTGHYVSVREQTVAGRYWQLGSAGEVQGHCQIGDFVRFQSNVFVGKRAEIGNYVWIFPYVVLTNDPHPPSNVLLGVKLRDYAAIATMSVVLPGVCVGEGALVGAHSMVSADVEPDTVVAGAPAKFICPTRNIKLRDESQASAYPWRRHFHRGYLPEDVTRWLAEFPAG